ncbi:MAG: CDP-diacylglycerol--glycerol-3-phosphate 3-phosphatidyltransferase [Firmicutes bacterium]|nr:CDP-diacylglycerol--glycerol-3-phosphate 3-phosphatidyltransferase [Bacillota bacterium]
MNLPNQLSLLRILLVPLMMFFYLADFVPYGKLIALVIFILAAVTDTLDGNIARKRNQVTDLGKLLDPIADKLLFTVGFLLVVADGTIPAPYGVIALTILILRDAIVNALRQIGTTKGIVFAAVLSGKLKAVFICILVPMYMALAFLYSPYSIPELVVITDYFYWACFGMLIISTCVTIWSALDYTLKNAALFKAKKIDEQGKSEN